MNTAKVFKNGNSQAVRLPKEFQFAGQEVLIKKVGRNVVLSPQDDPWSCLVQSLDLFTEDFMDDRNQPGQDERDPPLMRYMLDTNICIYIIKKKPAKVVDRLCALSISEVGISSITLAELEYGVAKSARPERNRDALIGFLTPLEIEAFGNEGAACYGALRAGLEKTGKPIGAMDLLIAAHALSLGAVLVTNNTREFERVPGLAMENWAAS